MIPRRCIAFADPAVFALERGDGVLVLCNLAEREAVVVPRDAASDGLLAGLWHDLLADDGHARVLPALLPAHALRWLHRSDTSPPRA